VFFVTAAPKSRGVELPQGRKAGPALRVLDNPALFVRDAVKLVNQFVDLLVGGGDFAFDAVEFPCRGRLQPGSSRLLPICRPEGRLYVLLLLVQLRHAVQQRHPVRQMGS
jgi:hypothetical protein